MMYIPQEVFEMNDETPIEVVMGYSRTNQIESNDAAEARIRGLEEEMEGLDLECEENGEANMKRMEEICDEISTVEENTGHLGENEGSIDSDVKFKVTKVLEYFGIKEDMQNTAMANLSGGQKKKVLLACSLCCDLDLLLLDGKLHNS
jgi:ATPase subunit of ABC transporter with duplicated ATPase domains